MNCSIVVPAKVQRGTNAALREWDSYVVMRVHCFAFAPVCHLLIVL
jgi:hypothetical protein